MERHEVRFGQELLEALHHRRAEIPEPLRGHVGVVGQDVHLEGAGPACDLLPDPAEADDPECLVRQLESGEARSLPAALLQGCVRLRDVPGERQQEPEGVLRCRDDGRLRGVRDDDPATRGRLHVDVVDPDTCAADHLQPLGPVDQLRGDVGGTSNDDRVVVGDLLLEWRVEVDIDLEAPAEEIDARVGDALADEDLHTRTPSKASSAAVTAKPRSMSAPASLRTSSSAASCVVTSKTST